MRVFIITTLALLLTLPIPSAAQEEVVPDLFRYDVPQLKQINRAVDVLEASGASLDDYDRVLYSIPKEGFYLITFTTSVFFAEDGPIRAKDVRMLFNAETEALIVLEADPLPKFPTKD